MYARAALLLRVAVALLTRTFFQPDEYFQSLEPAHQFVFGYGALTWEWFTSIRSIVYPALNIPLYALLKATGLAEAGALGDWLLVGTPSAPLFGVSYHCLDRLSPDIARKSRCPHRHLARPSYKENTW